MNRAFPRDYVHNLNVYISLDKLQNNYSQLLYYEVNRDGEGVVYSTRH